MSLTRTVRTIFISDLHLATRGCKADYLLDFLKHHDAEELYLIGDIVDGWRLRKSPFWVQRHNDVIQKILRKARKGARVYYIPGNHDEALRDYVGYQFGGIAILEEAVHRTADGRRLLVIHGDKFDGVVKHAKWLALLGEGAYDLALWANHWFNIVRRKLGYPYWSISAYLKERVKNAVVFITNFKTVMVEEARRRHLDGIVCGHLHRAEIQDVDGIIYCNCGDWVENCTALVEHFDGRLQIVEWAHIGEVESRADTPSVLEKTG